MISILTDPKKAEHLFLGWDDTMIRSCLQQVMGKILVTDAKEPKAACAHLGCFAFYAGKPDEEMVRNKPEGFLIMTPQNEGWAKLIEQCHPTAQKVTRYAMQKDTEFNLQKLQKIISLLPEGYELKQIDGELYGLCLKNPLTTDFVANFGSKEKFMTLGLGYVILKNGEIISGASSFSRYDEGIEIEVDTAEAERGKGLASIACAALILKCLEIGLYPSWDAQNLISVRLAEKLGYQLGHKYQAYETK